MYYTSLTIAVASGILYHVTQKSISHKVNPLISLMVTYGVALLITLIFYMFDRGGIEITAEIKRLNWASFVLGFAIVGLEIGILMAYRTGWDIGNLSLINNVLIAVILLPVGLLLFKEQTSLKTWVGMGVSLAGLILMKI